MDGAAASVCHTGIEFLNATVLVNKEEANLVGCGIANER